MEFPVGVNLGHVVVDGEKSFGDVLNPNSAFGYLALALVIDYVAAPTRAVVVVQKATRVDLASVDKLYKSPEVAAEVLRLNRQFSLDTVFATVGPKDKVVAQQVRSDADRTRLN